VATASLEPIRDRVPDLALASAPRSPCPDAETQRSQPRGDRDPDPDVGLRHPATSPTANLKPATPTDLAPTTRVAPLPRSHLEFAKRQALHRELLVHDAVLSASPSTTLATATSSRSQPRAAASPQQIFVQQQGRTLNLADIVSDVGKTLALHFDIIHAMYLAHVCIMIYLHDHLLTYPRHALIT